MEKKDIKEILNKVTEGTANAEEEQAAKYWLHYFSRKDIPELSEDELNSETETIYNSLMPGRTTTLQQPEAVKEKRLWYPAVAAACLLLVAGAGFFYYSRQNIELPKNEVVVMLNNDIAPGQNTATLILAGGKKIILSDMPVGKIAQQTNVSIYKTADGKLIYKTTKRWANGSANNSLLSELNTLTTTRGQQYQVILPDGSKIWLNADSKLTFPATFAAQNERKIELTGEAYFEVAKDKAHPFIVKTDNQQVEVLGTHFNIKSYADEHVTRTTLLEGSVKVSDKKEHRILKPGQQSLLSNNSLSVAKADTQETIAWKNGDFVFNNEEFGNILRQVARWYNVEITDNGNHETLRLSGTVSRSKNISAVLKALEVTGKVKFKVDGNRVIVTK